MGWSFRKSIRLGKGVRINLSRRGIGWSIGSKLLRFGVSGGRSRVSSGVGPFRYQKTLPNESTGGCGCLSLVVIVLAVGVVVGAMQSGSRSPRSETKADAPRSTPGSAPQPTANRQSVPPSASTNTAPTIPTPGASVRPLPVGPSADAAKQRAIARYPQLAVAGSALNRAFVERVHRYQRERPSAFDDPEWPTTIARECTVQPNP